MILHASKDIDEVVEGIDRTRLARGNEGVEAGEALAGRDVADKEVVLSYPFGEPRTSRAAKMRRGGALRHKRETPERILVE